MPLTDTQLRSTLERLGDEIRSRRERLGLSQDELGHLCGLHRTYIGSVERGERNLTFASLVVICQALGLAPHTLVQKAEAGA